MPCRRGEELAAGFPSRTPFHLLPLSYATVRSLKELLPAGSDYPVLHLRAPSQSKHSWCLPTAAPRVTPRQMGPCRAPSGSSRAARSDGELGLVLGQSFFVASSGSHMQGKPLSTI